MSPPAICCGTTPTFCSTWPAMPPMRNLRPERSATVLISLRNQPPIWVPVLPQGKPITPCFLKNSLPSSMPPPWYHQEFCWRALRPNGTEA